MPVKGEITDAITLIAYERAKQQQTWSAEHDDEHDKGEIALAAACYATPVHLYRMNGSPSIGAMEFCEPWPWDRLWDKRGKSTRIRDLIKAGALIVAEIERLQRVDSAK